MEGLKGDSMKRMLFCVLVFMVATGLYANETNKRYVVTLEMKQTHFSLNLGKHLKDSMNKATLQIPVDKEYYDAVKIGTVLNNKFRSGSLLTEGSLGKWKVTVIKKTVKTTKGGK